MTMMGVWDLGASSWVAILRLFIAQDGLIFERVSVVRLKPGKQVYVIENPVGEGRLAATLQPSGVVDLVGLPRYGLNYGGF